MEFLFKISFLTIFSNENTTTGDFLFSQRKHSYFFLQSNKHSQKRIPLRNQQNSYLTLPSSLNSSGLVTFSIFCVSSFELAVENMMVLRLGTSSLNLLVAFSLYLNKCKNFLICFHYYNIFLPFVSVSNLCSISIKGTTNISFHQTQCNFFFFFGN